VAAFQEKVPTTENLCIDIYNRLKTFSHAKLERVRIEETRNNSFEYAGENSARVPIASAAQKEQM
jgi:6-pyruvoyltetrahydropterin/6-carboxytetrahydropterin synthase